MKRDRDSKCTEDECDRRCDIETERTRDGHLLFTQRAESEVLHRRFANRDAHGNDHERRHGAHQPCAARGEIARGEFTHRRGQRKTRKQRDDSRERDDCDVRFDACLRRDEHPERGEECGEERTAKLRE